MAVFKLKIVTPDHLAFDGDAERVLVRTLAGDVAILPNHAEFATALGISEARVTYGGQTRAAALNGGMLTVVDNEVSIMAITFEWADEIDVERAKRAAAKAREALKDKHSQDADFLVAEARLKRSLARIKARG